MPKTMSVAIAFAVFIAAEATFLGGADPALVQIASTESSEAPAGWELVKSATWCSNRIVVGTGTWEECLDKVVADSKCSKVSYSNPNNNNCFCVPDGETCTEESASFTDVYKYTAPPEEAVVVPAGWELVKSKTWCKNRIVVGTGTWEECLDKVVADSKCSKVSYSNPKNNNCFCVPDGETCSEASADFTSLYKYTAPPKEPDACDGQDRFDIQMCNSFMCTKCASEFCMTSCQEVQADFPTCRCASWPKARKSYSGGDFASKGQYGDSGDYAKAASAFLSTEIVNEA